MLDLPHLMSRADTNQWLSRNDGFFDTAASCELGLEKEAAVSDDDGDSAVEADEASAEEDGEDEPSSAEDEDDHEADHDMRARAVPRARRRTLSRRGKPEVSLPTPASWWSARNLGLGVTR